VRRRKMHNKHMCAVRCPTAHDKGVVFAVGLVLVHGKGNEHVNKGNSEWEKMFGVC
jgi:hypothetical protein